MSASHQNGALLGISNSKLIKRNNLKLFDVDSNKVISLSIITINEILNKPEDTRKNFEYWLLKNLELFWTPMEKKYSMDSSYSSW